LLNELISNSLKHAFTDQNEDGVITVKLDLEPSGKFILEIGDNGIGIPKDFTFNSAHTLGMELVVTLSSQLDGTIERIDKPGSHFRIEFAGLEKERADIKMAMQTDAA